MSATKFAYAERDLKAARPLGAAAQLFYKHVEVSAAIAVFELFSFPAELGIRDILVRIRIPGSVPLANGSGSGSNSGSN